MSHTFSLGQCSATFFRVRAQIVEKFFHVPWESEQQNEVLESFIIIIVRLLQGQRKQSSLKHC
jgi:hypothetical protein